MKKQTYNNKFYFFVLGLILFLGQFAVAQIKLRPYNKPLAPVTGNTRLAPGSDNLKVNAGTEITVALPFFEDFTSYNINDSIPHISLWQKHSGVKVSLKYGKNYVNNFAAVLDGKDSSNAPYHRQKADSLVSNPIDLSAFKSKNLIRLSFRYECGGKALRALPTDSIRLFFNYDSLGTLKWKKVWSQAGDSIAGTGKTLMDTTFLRVVIPLNNDAFFHRKFQFKFQSVGPDSVFFGTWHIDSIYINDAYLTLPFFDEFSENTPNNLIPRKDLWLPNSGVQINNDYAINAPTVNVATFDGADANGTPYAGFSQRQGLGDDLISRPINLAGLQPSDNVRLSFFYECGGRGEKPDYIYGDSLVLKFSYMYVPDSIPGIVYKQKDTLAIGFKSVWSQFGCLKRPDSLNTNGDILSRYDDTSFVFVSIPLDNAHFFHKDFQFKFQSFGKQAGNYDVWQLDYIYMDKNRSNGITDKYLNERALIAFVEKPFKEFTGIPYTHYNKNSSVFINDSISFTATNLNTFDNPFIVNSVVVKDLTTKTTRDSVDLSNYNFAPIAAYQVGYLAKVPVDLINTGAAYPDNVAHFQEILTRVRLTSKQDSIKSVQLGIDLTQNDKVDYITRLYDYYSFDDGLPEYTAEIVGKGSLMAYRYVFPVQDTITAVDIHFSQNVKNLSGEQFKLVLWKRIKLRSNDKSVKDSIIYVSEQQSVKYNLVHNDSISDGFFRYPLAIADIGTAIVKDTVYIGYRQDSEILRVAYDYDENASGIDKIFSNTSVNGEWDPLVGAKGHLLIRPVFGKYTNIIKNTGKVTTGPPADYPGGPNPTTGTIYTLFGVHPDTFILNNVSGGSSTAGVTKTPVGADTEFDISTLSAGMYIMTYKVGANAYTKKIIVIK